MIKPKQRRERTVDISIRRPTGLGCGGAVFLILCALLAWQFQSRGALLAAVLVACATGAMSWGWWSLQSTFGGVAQLRLADDGRAILVGHVGEVEGNLDPSSLRFGCHLLLVLQTDLGRRRLLLGPGNLSGAEQAALGRWLRLAP